MAQKQAMGWSIGRSSIYAFCLDRSEAKSRDRKGAVRLRSLTVAALYFFRTLLALLLVPGPLFSAGPYASEMEAQQLKSAAKLKAKCLRVWGVQGVNGRVRYVAFGRDSKMVAANYDDGSLCIWDDAGNEDKKPRVLNNAGGNCSLAFSTDGKTIITGARRMEWWDIASGKKVEQKDSVVGTNLHFSPDCALVAGFSDIKVRIGHLDNSLAGTEWVTLPAQAKITAIAFSPDNENLVVAEWDGGVTLRWWNMKSSKDWKVRRLSMDRRVTALAFSANGKILAAGGYRSGRRNPGLWIFDSTNPQWHQEYYPNTAMRFGSCEQLALSPDGRMLIGDGKVWDLTTKKLIAVLEGCGSGPMVVSPDGKKLAVATGNSVHIYDLPNPASSPQPPSGKK